MTKAYIKVFNDKDSKDVCALLDEDFVLEDPAVKRIEGKQKALEAVENIFNSCKNLEFKAKDIYKDRQTTLIEFVSKPDEVKLEGVDILEWQGDKIKELRAYLDLPK